MKQLNNPELTASRQRKLAIACIGTAVLGMIGAENYVENYPRYAAHKEASLIETNVSSKVTDIASAMADKAVRVHCGNRFFDAPDEDNEDGTITVASVAHYDIWLPLVGSTPIASDDIYMRQGACERAAKAIKGRKAWRDYPSSTAFSLLTLSHEIEHTNGIYNEAQASCYALQRLPARLAQTGLRAADITTIVDSLTIEPIYNQSKEYHSKECAPHGAYDLGINGPFIALH